jgi:hypothetical protein
VLPQEERVKKVVAAILLGVLAGGVPYAAVAQNNDGARRAEQKRNAKRSNKEAKAQYKATIKLQRSMKKQAKAQPHHETAASGIPPA